MSVDGDGEPNKAVIRIPIGDTIPAQVCVAASPDCMVSVVIPTYNRPEILRRVLYTLFKQNDSNYEVLVSNDDSPDRYKSTLAVCNDFIKLGMPLTHFYTGQFKRGVGWSVETYPYNVGIRHAKGEIIILNSGDVMSVGNTIQQHRQKHQEGDRVYISTVHALILDVQNKIDTYPWKENAASLLFKGSCYKMFTGYGRSYTADYEVEDAGSPYHFQMSIRGIHLHRIRGFDEDFYGGMPCADDDLADRLRRSGLQFAFVSEICAIHQHHMCVEGGPAEMNSKVGCGYTLYAQRRGLSVVRNKNHEWGQFPRDMTVLPVMSEAF